MKVLITGAGGMLGIDVVAAAERANHEVVALTRADLDITDQAAVDATFALEFPQAVINCAAYTAVDLAESEPEAAMLVNATGAGYVATAAAAINAKVVFPSTDYVFDGTKGEPYIESDETNPLSSYGASKLAGELATAVNPQHMIVRTSWLFGLDGKNFVETMLSLGTQHGEVLVVRDQIGAPTYTRDLADALVALLDTAAFGLHHITGAGECSWWDFAVEIFRQSGIECNVMSGTTELLGKPAPRPAYSVLASARPGALTLPRWDHGLHSYLLARAEREQPKTGTTREVKST